MNFKDNALNVSYQCIGSETQMYFVLGWAKNAYKDLTTNK